MVSANVLLQTEPLPSTNTRLPAAELLRPIVPDGFQTLPPLVTMSWLPVPLYPTKRLAELLQSEPLPVTSAELLLLSVSTPMKLEFALTTPPVATTREFE